MNTFISCDWGTSAFRLRLVNADTQAVLAGIKTNEGIAAVYNDWQAQQHAERLPFYTNILAKGIALLEQACKHSLENITIVISGMASSSIGMMELPYKALPFRLDGTDVLTEIIEPSPGFKHKLLVISGAKTDKDVMRGEETKLLGCKVAHTQETQLLVLPGTHTKHAVVQNGIVTDFKTYMTGELFNLLSTKSVLAASVEEGDLKNKQEQTSYFLKGVLEGANNNMLNSIFHVRTFRLFNYHSPQQSYQYLSGLLIGNELKDLTGNKYSHISLVAAGVLAPLYRQALEALHISITNETNGDEALLAGQCKMFLQLIKQL